ncbi:MAG: bile acid:sodium symporter family protein [Akkermansiaceae bacterium]|jgi:bile acid:Na+ symporter, BASS family|nr:bile acid:sodium symporter family protein [Akkermansiaceae bacterium]MDP4647561.1 bile acid:sodium symporter family protein [Akkermansiaceae bacterium]MDP4720720.1 bile acid:sodium symporter family protein [Akkermansiaceae bacterium]MDP4779123.1 bile acid:sodium symporter family protein [Akkermansiaceae bacterium]MDP4897464.1 bile acid:sodium symporter family protein [Akkermansiaceae bacterium]
MRLSKISATLTTAFPFWLILGCVWAWLQPDTWTWFSPWIAPALGVIMLGMGLTLRFSDFASVLKEPKRIALGVFAQFGIMPLVGWGLAKIFGLETGLALGLILVACCPGGTVSNVICHLAKANVPLSVLLTMTSTMTAVVVTPLLTSWLAGAWMPVDAWALFKSMVIVVLLPLIVGISVNTLLGKMKDARKLREGIDAIGPLVSALVVVAIVGCIVAGKRDEIASAAVPLFVSVILLHGFGFFLGYFFAKLTGCKESLRRTISIEVGMQNSGLAAALATKHFPSIALAPVPAAISAVFHSLIGSALAAWWRRKGTVD